MADETDRMERYTAADIVAAIDQISAIQVKISELEERVAALEGGAENGD